MASKRHVILYRACTAGPVRVLPYSPARRATASGTRDGDAPPACWNVTPTGDRRGAASSSH
jgi:hypothetical protein